MTRILRGLALLARLCCPVTAQWHTGSLELVGFPDLGQARCKLRHEGEERAGDVPSLCARSLSRMTDVRGTHRRKHQEKVSQMKREKDEKNKNEKTCRPSHASCCCDCEPVVVPLHIVLIRKPSTGFFRLFYSLQIVDMPVNAYHKVHKLCWSWTNW